MKIHHIAILGALALLTTAATCSRKPLTKYPDYPWEHEAAAEEEEYNINILSTYYFTIDGSTYSDSGIPAPTTDETLKGVKMTDKAMSGTLNYVTVATPQNVSKFYVGVKDVPGHYEYAAQPKREGGVNTYTIPLLMSVYYQGECTILLSGELADGRITPAFEKQVKYIETKAGALEVKLTFSNAKDIDLHLYTPRGQHIFYGNRGGKRRLSDGSLADFGLDIDSNGGCSYDGKNAENIIIPGELVEEGEYRVVVNMYSNCNPRIPTDWTVMARYNDEMLPVKQGANPASGTYRAGAGTGDNTVAMKFDIHPVRLEMIGFGRPDADESR